MSDWVEFKDQHRCMVSLRPECIHAFSELNDGCKNKNICEIYYDFGNEEESTPIFVRGTYEQVKQKIMDAEKYEPVEVQVEHFTRDEYEILYKLIDLEVGHTIGTSEYIPIKRIRDKLNKMLEAL